MLIHVKQTTSLRRAALLALLVATTSLIAAEPLPAEDLPCVDTTFRLIGRNDRVCVSVFDDPEVPGVVAALKARGARVAILSNGDPDMLEDAVRAANLAAVFDAVLSVSTAGISASSWRTPSR